MPSNLIGNLFFPVVFIVVYIEVLKYTKVHLFVSLRYSHPFVGEYGSMTEQLASSYVNIIIEFVSI